MASPSPASPTSRWSSLSMPPFESTLRVPGDEEDALDVGLEAAVVQDDQDDVEGLGAILVRHLPPATASRLATPSPTLNS
jgi:hypothetical protein